MIQSKFDTLPKLFPKLFPNPNIDISVGEGWYDIVHDLCALIQDRIDGREMYLEQYPEKRDTVRSIPQVEIGQIKQKFGQLRFYYAGGDDYIDGMVDMAGAVAYKMCEVCGKPGELDGDGWLMILCEEHKKQRQQENKELDELYADGFDNDSL